jgi:hypothetical protein
VNELPELSLWRKWVHRIILGVAVGSLAFKGLDLLARRTGPLPTVPKPNAYADALAVAARIKLPRGEFSELSNQAVQSWAQTNRDALQNIEAVVGAESGVPLEVKVGWPDRHAQDVAKLKRLAVALALQARAEQLESRTNAAARTHLNIIMLGELMGRGGTLNDTIYGLTIETLGAASLRGDLIAMDAPTSSLAARALAKADAHRDQPEQVLETQRRWAVKSFGLISRAGGIVLEGSAAKRLAELETRWSKAVGRTRRLTLMLAARAYELETGQPAKQPADLIPKFLPAIPLDPDTKAPFRNIPKPVGEGG